MCGPGQHAKLHVAVSDLMVCAAHLEKWGQVHGPFEEEAALMRDCSSSRAPGAIRSPLPIKSPI